MAEESIRMRPFWPRSFWADPQVPEYRLDAVLVMETTGCSECKAKDALTKTGGDIADAIILIRDNLRVD